MLHLNRVAIARLTGDCMAPNHRLTELVSNGDAIIETLIDGKGPAIVMLPSYGRDVGADFNEFAEIVAEAGFHLLRPRPRGIGRSSGSMHASLQDMADDAAKVIQHLADGTAIVMGHAYGTGVARILATSHSEMVGGIILANAPADKPPADTEQLPFIAGNPALPEEERLQALSRGFFAPHHDARPWLSGWYPETLQMQKAALAEKGRSAIREGGTAPILQIISESDPFNPFDSWRERREKWGARVTARIVADASHSLFPEQTPIVAEIVIRWLQTV